MKKFNRLLALSVIMYLFLASVVGLKIYKMDLERSGAYKVEMNRILNSLSKEKDFDRLDLASYNYIKKVEFLPVSEINEEKNTEFYGEVNDMQTRIKAWYEDGTLLGYVKFIYKTEDSGIRELFLIMEVGFFVMEVFLIGILLYLKKRLLTPFQRISDMPGELAKGHLKGEVKEEKSRYFGEFVWGIGQLKDALDVSKRRRLHLEKEKKELLLSLSHDIKTPLNTIKLYGKALEENMYQEEVQKKHAYHQIGEKAVQIEKFVEEIMKTSREDILDFDIQSGEFYLSDLMKKVLNTWQEKCAVRLLELQIDTFENRLIKGDIDRAQEVVENIFENGFKYGDGRRIEISFFEEDYCQLIRIFNTGEPVTDNEFNHIFESFFRGANSQGKQGSGLGLYICREIMRRMDGEIFAEKSEDGMAFVLVFR